MRVSVIIPAAGRSERFGGGDKLAQDLGGRALLIRTAELFAKRDEVFEIIVAGPPDPASAFEAFRDRYGPTIAFHGGRIVPGGKVERWETVKEALNHVSDDATHVAVHDAARPATPNDVISRVFEAGQSLPAVIPGVQVRATVKRISAEATDAAARDEDDALNDLILGDAGRSEVPVRTVLETVDRANLVEVQTPQLFAVDLLRRAYEQTDLDGATDDAGLVERLGEAVHVVEGDVRNIKVTDPGDLALVRAILGVKPPAERPVHKRF